MPDPAALDVVDHANAPVPARPAATVVLVRDGASGIEVLMIHRGAATAFGGMWAFPGGVVEADDVPPGTAPDPLPAARAAAVRETREEVGLVVDSGSLVFWSHWVPPLAAPKRFSTWFFLAPATAAHGDEHVGIDGDEVNAHRWVGVADALAAQASGDVQVAPPTFVTLHDLLAFGTVAEALAAADPEYFATEVVADGTGTRWCVWAGDAAYPDGDITADGPRHRIAMVDGPWVYEQSRRPGR